VAIPIQVTFDAKDPRRLGGFWRELLEYGEQPPPPGHHSWDDYAASIGMPEEEWDGWYACIDPAGNGARLFFQRVPEGKTAKNRVHLDVNVGGPRGTPDDERRQRVDAAVQRAIGLGASLVEDVEMRDERWVVLTDPEGNEFCLQ
jgi:hypothetical protein